MALFKNSTFVGQRIQIDGHRFEDCHFENCVLVYGGGSLHFVGNGLSGVTWEFVEAAARTVSLLSSFYQSGESGGEARQFVERLLSTVGRAASEPSPITTGATSTVSSPAHP